MRVTDQIGFLIGTVLTFGAMAQGSLRVGDAAPDFSLADQTGATIRLSDFRGKKSVVLAFYVKAFTSG